jgi:2,4-dichlorophenol 6-monooxygenase
VLDDGTPEVAAPRDEEIYYFATTRPGRHLPHIWLTRDQRRVALFDLCGKGRFTVLTGIGGEKWRQAAERCAERFGVPITLHTIGRGGDYEDSYGDFWSTAEVEDDSAILVRPDHMIAWRAADSHTDPTRQLTDAFGSLLGRQSDQR